GFDWRPYIMRTYFDTRMMMAEADGLIIRDWRVFWMGHKGDMEHRYTLNKGRLPEDLIEKMRVAFAKASERYVVTTSKRNGDTQDIVRSEMNKLVLEMAEFEPEEIDKLGDLSKLTSTDMNKIMEDRQKAKLGLNGNSQKVVLMTELEKYIMEGWEYVRDLPPKKAIVRLPNSRND
ncbi:MAG: site-specific integrase, partial [Nitrososphaera sp.]